MGPSCKHCKHIRHLLRVAWRLKWGYGLRHMLQNLTIDAKAAVHAGWNHSSNQIHCRSFADSVQETNTRRIVWSNVTQCMLQSTLNHDIAEASLFDSLNSLSEPLLVESSLIKHVRTPCRWSLILEATKRPEGQCMRVVSCVELQQLACIACWFGRFLAVDLRRITWMIGPICGRG